ncbi:DUF2834 domain-containing protein [Merismopedia glauca]|uniref:DUF2834 domain-containing protein n=1 Tax=Merismopedia glauca CCAP 1448/3 TaxID=1296344 RepID=A0A2T1BXB1_9CYAN|nr:DUF2834 domain-containing protein [Merismopedia glauca]PSB00649.1 DUF2834 domain-containing protein [Merismopedia glauca CCAP 1448/3]
MNQKPVFLGIWLGLILYAAFIAPPNDPNTTTLILNLSTGSWEGINPLVISLFNLMGIWPIIYMMVLLFDGREQKIPAWPFVATSFGVGAFALLPYLALRQPNPEFSGEKNLLLKILDSRWLGLAVTLGALTLLGYGLISGDWQDFVRQWESSKFIHVMSLDFCLLCLLFTFTVQDDLKRRQTADDSPLQWIVWVPFLGALVYLCRRSPTIAKIAKNSTPKEA